jgi:hypothetical protein
MVQVRRIVVSLAALAALAVVSAKVAVAHPRHSTRHRGVHHARTVVLRHTRSTEGDNPSEAQSTESDGDSAVQAAACQKAGIDPRADNVEYDDQTGVCGLDTAGGSGA